MVNLIGGSFKGAFGPTIEPMDFDGVVERCGWFLVFETKNPGVVIPRGQQLALERAVLDRRWTVIKCAKKAEHILDWEVWTAGEKVVYFGNAEDLWYWCNRWYACKSRQPLV